MKFEYNVKAHGALKPRKVVVDFNPYENLISEWNGDVYGWDTSEGSKLVKDEAHPIALDRNDSLRVVVTKEKEITSIKKTAELEPGKKYFISLYIRNNDAVSSALYLNGKYTDKSTTTYTETIGGIAEADDEGKIEVDIRLYDVEAVPVRSPVEAITAEVFSRAAWIDGLQAVEIEEGDETLSKKQLVEKYPFAVKEKTSPSARDLLDKMFHFSPYRYYLVADGRRITDYHKSLDEYGVNKDTCLETYEAELAEQIFTAFTHDVPLMAMLEGRKSHVSYAYPKEDRDMSRLHKSHFPRLQFFTGFAVNKNIADSSPIAEETNFAINVYIPITKVMESVSAVMIATQMSAVMAELGWAKVRGSDYFLKNEQLYVLQTQFIQDLMKSRKRY